MRFSEPPAKNPLNIPEPFKDDDGLHISSSDPIKHNTLNAQFYRDTNPITKAEIEAKKFQPLPKKAANTSADHTPEATERILQIHVTSHTPPASPPPNHKPPKTHSLSVRSFCALWHRYNSLHKHAHPSLQTLADAFQKDLVLLLEQEQRRAIASVSWTTPASLLEILSRAFALTAERFCSPLNFCPLFPSGSTIGADHTKLAPTPLL